VLWIQGVHTDREVTANRPDIIIKNKKGKTCTLIDVAIPADRNLCAKGSGKEVKIQEFRYSDTTHVEPEMYDYTSYNWSHWNSNEKLKEKSEALPGKHLIDLLQKTAILGTSHVMRKVLQCET
jgi:hypothetical protein